MGLDIYVQTKGVKPKAYYFRDEPFKTEYKKIEDKMAELRKLSEEERDGRWYDEVIVPAQEIEDKVEQYNLENGNVELYFRKKPRVLVSILEQVEIERGMKENELRDECNSFNGEQNRLCFEGTIKIANLKKAFDKENLKKNTGYSGFFWGQDGADYTFINQEYKKFMSKLKKLGLTDNDEVYYYFSW